MAATREPRSKLGSLPAGRHYAKPRCLLRERPMAIPRMRTGSDAPITRRGGGNGGESYRASAPRRVRAKTGRSGLDGWGTAGKDERGQSGRGGQLDRRQYLFYRPEIRREIREGGQEDAGRGERHQYDDVVVVGAVVYACHPGRVR